MASKFTKGLIKLIRFLLFKTKSTIYGNAQFMGFFERRKFLSPRNKGIYLSRKYRLSLQESYKNLALIAPTGSGKTTRYVIPNILKCEGSVVVTDPSGEICKLTSNHMKQRGYKIQVLDPTSTHQSLRFNPIVRFTNHQGIKYLATILGSQNAGCDPFWTVAAINLIYICLVAVRNTHDESQINLAKVRYLLNAFGVKVKEVEEYMKRFLDEHTFEEYKAFLAQDSRVSASIISSARTALDLWSDPEVIKLTSENTVSIEALRKEKTITYIIVPEHQIKYFGVFVNLFYGACFEYALQQPEGIPIFFFLDEFGNLGQIPNFATIATTLRKRNCSISIILQELSQLRIVYGKDEAQAIFSGGMNNKLYFSGQDLETCKYLEQVLGSKTEYDTIKATGEVKIDNQIRTLAKPLMRSDEIRQLPETEAIFISGRQKPIRLEILPYFHDRQFRKLVSKPR